MRRPQLTPEYALAGVSALTVAWVGFDDGGYFPPVWGWTALCLTGVTALALVLRGPLQIAVRLLLFSGALALLVVWEALSLYWSSNVTLGVEDVQRDLMYVTAALVVAALSSRRAGAALRSGVLGGTLAVCGWSVLTRLYPDRLGFYNVDGLGRLYNPLGYWNAQGVLAAIGIVLLCGVVASSARPWSRALAAAAMPFVALDCYFTLSRGAVIALAIGLMAMLSVDPRRTRTSAWLLLAAPWPVMAVLEAHRQPLLAGVGFGPAAVSEGHRVAAVTVVLALMAGLAVGTVGHLESRLRVPGTVRRGYVLAWVLAVVALAATATDRYGTPVDMAREAYHAFTGAPPTSRTSARLLSLSLHGRTSIWAVAWRDAERHPVDGSGAGTYSQQWLLRRPYASATRWADNLYLQVLAETGAVGLAILLTALALPLVAGVRSRGDPVVPAVFGAYAAFLAHSAVDWDWQMPALALVALWCGAAMLINGRAHRTLAISGRIRSAAFILTLGLAGLAAFGLAGSRDLAISTAAADAGRYGAALSSAEAANRWQPWSYLPWMAVGQARVARGDVAGARAAYRNATSRDAVSWDAWLALAQVSTGPARVRALRRARRLNPLSPEIASFCRTNPGPGCADLGVSRGLLRTRS